MGFVLTLSLWFMSAGLPLLAGGVLSIRGVLRADVPGASHPALFVSFLAMAEGTLGLIALDLLPDSNGQIFGAVFLSAAGITALVGWSLWRQTEPLAPPPPPRQGIGLL